MDRLVRVLVLTVGLLFAARLGLAEEIALGGRVTLAGGEPLARAEVQLLPLRDGLAEAGAFVAEGAPEPLARALTDDDGRYRLSAPRAGLWRVRVSAEGFVPLENTLTPLLEPVELPDAAVEADSRLRVRAADAGGRPVAGALVLVRTDRSRFEFGQPDWTIPVRIGRTGPDGTVVLPKAGNERVVVTASADGSALAERAGLIGGEAKLVLDAGEPRTLKVVATDGTAVAGVLVGAGGRAHPVGRTDAKGELMLRAARGEGLDLRLLSDDKRHVETRIEPVQNPDEAGRPRVIELPDRALVAGRVIDLESRRGIADGVVWDEGNPLEAVTTDGNGGFAIGGPAGARLRLVAGAPGYLVFDGMELQIADDGRPSPTLALRPAASIEGQVLDGDGEPVAGALVRLEERHTPGSMRIEIGRPRVSPRNLSNGRGAFRLSGVDPEKRYTVKADAAGFAPGQAAVGELEARKTRRGIDVTLTRGKTIAGTVVDKDGRGVAETAITVRPDRSRGGMGMMRVIEGGGEPVTFDAVSDDDGKFEVTGLPVGRFTLEARRRGFAKGGVAGVEVAEAGETVHLGEIVLQPGQRLGGTVRDDDGAPIEGAAVFVREGGGPQMMMILGGHGPDEPAPDAHTDPTGWFQIEDLAAGTAYSVRCERSGYIEGRAEQVDPGKGEPVELVMNPASNVSGVILDASGEPIRGAQVLMHRRQTLEMGGNVMVTMMIVDATSDGDGRFLFEDQRPGKVAISAVAAGHQEARRDDVEIPKGEDVEGLELRLEDGAIVQGRVLTPDGRAVIGARVSKVGEGEEPMRMLEGSETDGNGVFRLEGLAPGAISVEAQHGDYPRAVKDVDLEPGLNLVDLQFEGGTEVSGQVTDEDGAPVPDALVRLNAAGRMWGGPEARSGAGGTFVIPGVPDGDYRLIAQAEGYAASSAEQAVQVAGSPLTGLAIVLESGGSIAGRVTGLEPDQYSKVNVRAEGATFGFDGTSADHEGHYRLEHLRPGDYEVVATLSDSGRSARGRIRLEAGSPEARLDLQFQPGLTLSGRALQGGRAVVGATVFAEGLDRPHTGWSQTGHDGSFSIEGLEPGSFRVNLRDFVTGLSHTETVDISTSREIVLRVPTASVTGRVVDSADRRPLSGVTMLLTSGDPAAAQRGSARTATTDLDGRFEIGGVADGSWRLVGRKEGYAAVTRDLQVQHERPVGGIDLLMDPTEGLTLEVRMPTGAPASDVQLAVLDPAGTALVSGFYATGENGRIRLSTIPPGEWSVLVSAPGAATETVTVTAPGPTIQVSLKPATELRVKVPALEDSGALATVVARDAGGTPFRTLGWTGSPQTSWRMAGGSMTFGSMPPGTWTIDVTAGDDRWSGVASTAPGNAAELRLE